MGLGFLSLRLECAIHMYFHVPSLAYRYGDPPQYDKLDVPMLLRQVLLVIYMALTGLLCTLSLEPINKK